MKVEPRKGAKKKVVKAAFVEFKITSVATVPVRELVDIHGDGTAKVPESTQDVVSLLQDYMDDERMDVAGLVSDWGLLEDSTDWEIDANYIDPSEQPQETNP